jgi:hypothetical protein
VDSCRAQRLAGKQAPSQAGDDPVGCPYELTKLLRPPPLLGHHGAPAAYLAALQDILLRVSRLADDLPHVAELDLSPVIARPGDAHMVDARVRLRPAEPTDPYLRSLR